MDQAEALLKAAQVYAERNGPKGHRKFPNGHFSGYGVWYPNPSEVAECCKKIKIYDKEGVKWKYTLLKHCATFQHIASLYGVDGLILKRAVYRQIWKKDEFRRMVLIKALLAEPQPERRKRGKRGGVVSDRISHDAGQVLQDPPFPVV